MWTQSLAEGEKALSRQPDVATLSLLEGLVCAPDCGVVVSATTETRKNLSPSRSNTQLLAHSRGTAPSKGTTHLEPFDALLWDSLLLPLQHPA